MREVVGPARVPRAPATALRHAGAGGVRLPERAGVVELAVPDQLPVLRVPLVVRGLEQVPGRAELRGTDDPVLEPSRLVDHEVALPDHEVGYAPVQFERWHDSVLPA